MNTTSTSLAGLALAAALLVSGCSTSSGTATVGTSASASTATTSLDSAPVAELSYADLEVDEADLSFDAADAVEVVLADGASEGPSGVSVDDDIVTITEAGTYRVTGTLSAGSVVVDAPDGVVNLVLDGVSITAASVAAISVVDAQQVVVWLADGSENVLSDAPGAVVDETVQDSPNATLFSTSDLWIAGDGSLAVTAHAADAITSKDTLVMAGGDVTVVAADDGVRGKDHLVITGGTLTADTQGDALRSDNETVTEEPDAAVGVIWISGGSLDLTAGSDAVDAARQVTVLGGDLVIAAGDDALHSDNVLRIDGGTVDITESFEGIEAAYMFLSGGDVHVVAADDGINVSGGVEELATTADEGVTGTEPDAGVDQGMAGGEPGAGGPPGGEAAGGPMPEAVDGQLPTSETSGDLSALTVSAMQGSGFGGPAEADNGSRFLEFSGGTYVIDASSDGVDVNGAMAMTGGTLVVSGTDDVRNGALDVDDAFTISGGTLAANGTSAMAVAPGEGSTQAILAMTFSSTVPADTVITVSDAQGEQVASFTTLRDSQSLVYSSDDLVEGTDYTISLGADVATTSTSPLALDSAATGGEAVGTITAA